MNISTLDLETLGSVIQLATELGYFDAAEKREPRTGKQVLRAVGATHWTNGHTPYFKSAYSLGRWQQEVQYKAIGA